MEWANPRSTVYQKPPTLFGVLFQCCGFGIFLGSLILFLVEYYLFYRPSAFYEIARCMCWADWWVGERWIESDPRFWLPINGYGKVNPYKIVFHVEQSFFSWFWLRLILVHIVSMWFVFWIYRVFSLLPWPEKTSKVEEEVRGTRIVPLRKYRKLIKRKFLRQ